MDSHADGRAVRTHVASEDLCDADLAGSLRLVLEADHPQCDHAARIGAGAESGLDDAVLRGVEPLLGLFLAHLQPVVEVELADRAAERTGEQVGLERRDADVAVPFGAPRLLGFVDAQPQRAVLDLVAGAGRGARAPVRQVVGHPPALVEVGPVERLVELELVPGLRHRIWTVAGPGSLRHAMSSTRPIADLLSVA